MIDSMPCPRVLCHDFHSHFDTITSHSQSQCKCNPQCILISTSDAFASNDEPLASFNCKTSSTYRIPVRVHQELK